MAQNEIPGTDSTGGMSRREMLRGLTALPAVTSLAASRTYNMLKELHEQFEDAPATLTRTRDGRSLSLHRYHSAERAFLGIGGGFYDDDIRTALHEAGAVAKLALCAYLLDVGFPDLWNAEHIRQDISKALAYANTTGLGHHCPETAHLAATLTPYWKWGYPQLIGDPPMDHGGLKTDQVRSLVRALLDRVYDVTGHPRPSGWERMQEFRA